MDNLARQKLIEIVQRHGLSVLENPNVLKGLLADHGLNRSSRERSVLLAALAEKAPQQLLARAAVLPLDVQLGQLARHLHGTHAIELEAARWAVESWAEALGLMKASPVPPPPPRPDPPGASPTPPTPPAAVPPELLPLLDGLARLIARGSNATVDELRTLLKATNIKDKAAALEELKCWKALLLALRRKPTGPIRLATIEALRVRNLPEASLVAAVEIIMASTSTPVPATPKPPAPRSGTKAGTSTSGGTGTAKSRASGKASGQGATPAPKKNSARKPAGASSGKKSPPVQPPPNNTPLIISEKGQQFQTLEEALQKSPANATLHLRAGIYPLPHSVKLEKNIILIGENWGTTIITGNGPAFLFEVNGSANVRINGLTLRREGDQSGDLIRCNNYAQIAITGCRLEKARVENDSWGAALRICDHSRAVVTNSSFFGNEFTGIAAIDQSQLSAEQNIFNENQQGIVLWGNATGTIRGNTCQANARNGIFVNDSANALLEKNLCVGNQKVGIFLTGKTALTAQQNTCTANGQHGIYVDRQAQPRLENNLCQENQDTGIFFHAESSGQARQNQCLKNLNHGIYVDQKAHPTLEGNTCQENQGSGIVIVESAAGVVRKNISLKNGLYGIYVATTARPSLAENRCQGNKLQDMVSGGGR